MATYDVSPTVLLTHVMQDRTADEKVTYPIWMTQKMTLNQKQSIKNLHSDSYCQIYKKKKNPKIILIILVLSLDLVNMASTFADSRPSTVPSYSVRKSGPQRSSTWWLMSTPQQLHKCSVLKMLNDVLEVSIISNDLLGAYTSDDEENKSVSSMSSKSSIDPKVVVSTAAFHARVRGSVPGPGGLKETQMFLPHPRVKLTIVGSLCDREVACSASDRQGSNFELCVWRTVSSHSSHHPQEVLLAQFSLYVHKGGLKADSFHFIFTLILKMMFPENQLQLYLLMKIMVPVLKGVRLSLVLKWKKANRKTYMKSVRKAESIVGSQVSPITELLQKTQLIKARCVTKKQIQHWELNPLTAGVEYIRAFIFY